MKKLAKIVCCGLLLSLAGCKQEEPEQPQTETLELVSNESYESPLNPSKEFILAFNELSKSVKEEDLENISKNVALCFTYDFFTLKNKESSENVGGLTYLPQSRVDEFKSFAMQNYYRNYDEIVSKYGIDSLPEVMNVTIENTKALEVAYLEYTYDGYEIELSIEYGETKIAQEELKTSATMTLITYEGKAMVIALS